MERHALLFLPSSRRSQIDDKRTLPIIVVAATLESHHAIHISLPYVERELNVLRGDEHVIIYLEDPWCSYMLRLQEPILYLVFRLEKDLCE